MLWITNFAVEQDWIFIGETHVDGVDHKFMMFHHSDHRHRFKTHVDDVDHKFMMFSLFYDDHIS